MKIAIFGYGNLGKACERFAARSEDIEVVGIVTRRDPSQLSSPYGTRLYARADMKHALVNADVAAICTGSANDVMGLGEGLAGLINTVDSFDTHAKMAEYFSVMDSAARRSGHLSLVGIGWDPGLFSLIRALGEGVLPDSRAYTFWGRGVSQGHSEAIRRLDGVIDAVQYTVPIEDAIIRAESGDAAGMSDREMHRRECYVVAEEGADKAEIERKIKAMPNYFAPYDVTVHFVDLVTLKRDHGGMPHAGRVLRRGGPYGARCALDVSLKLDSNPDFTASVLMSYARAATRLAARGETGAKTILDVPVSALFDKDTLRFI